MYEVTIRATASMGTSNSRCITGSDTLTILLSMAAIEVPIISVTSTRDLFAAIISDALIGMTQKLFHAGPASLYVLPYNIH